jgi:RimJ/RimL family protein N-acetyltransferase
VKQAPDFATKPTLPGERVILRPFRDGDLPAIRAALLDPEARVLTGSVHDEAQAHAPESADEEELLLDWYRAEGVLRESLRYNGQWIDATVMSILAPEWG